MLSQAMGFYLRWFLAFCLLILVMTKPWVLLIPVGLFLLWFILSLILGPKKPPPSP